MDNKNQNEIQDISDGSKEARYVVLLSTLENAVSMSKEQTVYLQGFLGE